jgi:hypothetical protein
LTRRRIGVKLPSSFFVSGLQLKNEKLRAL